jgi:mono/diheme cytochrome c family protein
MNGGAMTMKSQSVVAMRWLAAPLSCLVLAGMTNAAPATGAPVFARQVQPIFDANCVACHQTAGASGGLNLEEGVAYRSIVSRKRGDGDLVYVVPGDPQASYLLRKLKGTHAQVGGTGEQMPPTGPLDSQSVATIQRWIQAGARHD